MRSVVLGAFLVPLAAAADEPATARYAPTQLGIAQEALERAREAAFEGDGSLAGSLAWQASLDARLAWAMSHSPQVRGPAFEIVSEADRLVRDALSRAGAPRATIAWCAASLSASVCERAP